MLNTPMRLGEGMIEKSPSLPTGRATAYDPVAPFALHLISNPYAVRNALAGVIEAIADLELLQEEISTVELVLAEVLNNITEHAYPAPDIGGPIRIEGRVGPDGLHLLIEDEGAPMPGGRAPIGHRAVTDVPLSDMPEGGFGWFLIRDLAKDVRYERKGQVNRLRLRVALAPRRLT